MSAGRQDSRQSQPAASRTSAAPKPPLSDPFAVPRVPPLPPPRKPLLGRDHYEVTDDSETPESDDASDNDDVSTPIAGSVPRAVPLSPVGVLPPAGLRPAGPAAPAATTRHVPELSLSGLQPATSTGQEPNVSPSGDVFGGFAAGPLMYGTSESTLTGAGMKHTHSVFVTKA